VGLFLCLLSDRSWPNSEAQVTPISVSFGESRRSIFISQRQETTQFNYSVTSSMKNSHGWQVVANGSGELAQKGYRTAFEVSFSAFHG
jgi:hypothetical protein